jgi:hypothetical protein
MTINTLLTAPGFPSCHCNPCAVRRAFRLTQALQRKYAPAVRPTID